MQTVAPFTGFGPDAMTFLVGLARNNSTAYFDEYRTIYDEQIEAPMKSLVVAVGNGLRARVNDEIDFAPKLGRSIFRIDRDVSLAKDKTPYYPYLDAMWWQGSSPRTSPRFILRISPVDVLTGVGIFGMDGERLEAFRTALLDEATGCEFDRLVAVTRQAMSGAAVREPRRATLPGGTVRERPRSEFLERNSVRVSASTATPRLITSAKFADWVVDRYAKTAALHQWLVEHVGD
jgi:uncharacterized protein (TIGR02453 family)